MERELWQACRSNRVGLVKNILTERTGVDVNYRNHDSGSDSALHVACSNGYLEVVKLLLDHPLLNLNSRNSLDATPLHSACLTGQADVVRVLLKDDETDVNAVDSRNQTPLVISVVFGYVQVVRVMVLSGRSFVPCKGTLKIRGSVEAAVLWRNFAANPMRTRQAVQRTLGLTNTMVAELFGLVIFLCDGLLAIRRRGTLEGRFFQMASRLPMELQMILCYRAYGDMRQYVFSHDSESAFRLLSRVFAKK